MLKKLNKQKDFFDSYMYEHLLPSSHVLLDILEVIDFSFVDKCTNGFYSDKMGRPGFHPQVMFKLLFLEFLYNMSDYEIAEQIRTNILFRYFAGLGIPDETPDHATLSMFRRRLGEERFKELFDNIVLQARKKKLLKGRLKILDSTHIQANASIRGAVNLLRHGRKRVLKRILKLNSQMAHNLEKKYLNEEKLHNLPSKDEIIRELELTGEFIKKVKDRFDDEVIGELIDLLETALGQQARKAEDPKYKQPDEIVNISDPDARNGFKSRTKRFTGYKGEIAMDEGSNIVTSARTIQGNKNEGEKNLFKEMLKDDKSKGIKHQAVAADSLYDSYENRKAVHKQKMRAFIPRSKKGNIKNSKLDNFIYDEKNNTLICPQGHSPNYRSRQENRDFFIFPAKFCSMCPTRKDCPKLNNGRVRINVSDNYKLSLLDNVPEKKEAFVKRKEIERKFAEGKLWHGLRRARYRRRWRVAIQTFMTFIVINVKRMVKLLLGRREKTLLAAGFG